MAIVHLIMKNNSACAVNNPEYIAYEGKISVWTDHDGFVIIEHSVNGEKFQDLFPVGRINYIERAERVHKF